MEIKFLIIIVPLIVAGVWVRRVIKGLIPKGVALALICYGLISTVIAWGMTIGLGGCSDFSQCLKSMDSRLALNMGVGLGVAIAGLIECFRKGDPSR